MKKYLALLLATGTSLSLTAQTPATPGAAKNTPVVADVFVPGDSVLFFDNFEQEKVQTSPSKWRYTIPAVVVNEGGQKWIRLKNQGDYQPKLKKPRAKSYTYEFDIIIDGGVGDHNYFGNMTLTIGEKAEMEAMNESMLEETYDYAQVVTEIMVGEPSNIYISNANGSASAHAFDETLSAKLGKKIHVSMAVDGKRFRLWFDDKLITDQPKLIYSDKFDIFRIALHTFNEKSPNHKLLLTNFRYASRPYDLKDRLAKNIPTGTAAIRFEPGTAKISPASEGAVKEIAQVLNENKNLKIKLTGHLDQSDITNPMQLSKQQAEAVRTMLIQEYGIQAARLEADGKGSLEPAAKGKSQEAKANNRRIEITKI